MSRPEGVFDDIAWERFLRIVAVVAFTTATFVFTAAEVLPRSLSTIAIGAIGSVGVVTAIIGFLIAAASTLDHAEERAKSASDPVTSSPDELEDVSVRSESEANELGEPAEGDAENADSEERVD
jgi:hypothetical protein